jgi:hypothetical protein
VIYNAVHTYVGPLALGYCLVWSGRRQALLLSLIWAAHIGLDRMLGFGSEVSDALQRRPSES